MADNGQEFGRFQLVRQLGKGGFGEVWLAYDPQLQREVALKVLHQGLLSDTHFVNRALQEARLVGKLDHPNIVKIHEAGEAAGRVYVEMEYIDGQPLSELIAAGRRFNLGQVCNFVGQVGSALQATHLKKVVHRDVKPANILIDSHGNAHLVDFGLAHAALSSLGPSANSVGIGTAMYMSPEEAAGQIGDPASDQYSLAVIAYELLTGKLPFQADTLMGYMLAHKEKAPPEPRQINPDISLPVQKVLLKALSKEPARRYKSVAEFASALQQAGLQPAQKPAGRRGFCLAAPMLLVVSAVLLVALVLAGIIPLPNPFAERRSTEVVAVGPTGPVVVETLAVATSISAAPATIVPPSTTPPVSIAMTVAPSVTPPATMRPTATQLPVEPMPTAPVIPVEPTAIVPTAAPAVIAPAAPSAVLVGSGVAIEAVTGGAAEPGKGQLVVRIRNGLGAPVEGVYLVVYTQKKDLAGHWVVDRRNADEYTDNAGLAIFNLDPGAYILQSDFRGYNWGSASDVEGQADVPVAVGMTTHVTVSLGRLTVGMLRGDDSVIEGQYVIIYTQKQDLAGNWVEDQRVADGYTDNTGSISFNLTPGYYMVASDFRGYSWGNSTQIEGMDSVALAPGQETRLITALGQLVVGLTDSAGQAAVDRYVRVYTQERAVSGALVVKQEVANGSTDNTGAIVFNLAPGRYALVIDKQELFDILVEAGKITVTNGVTFEVRP